MKNERFKTAPFLEKKISFIAIYLLQFALNLSQKTKNIRIIVSNFCIFQWIFLCKKLKLKFAHFNFICFEQHFFKSNCGWKAFSLLWNLYFVHWKVFYFNSMLCKKNCISFWLAFKFTVRSSLQFALLSVVFKCMTVCYRGLSDRHMLPCTDPACWASSSCYTHCNYPDTAAHRDGLHILGKTKCKEVGPLGLQYITFVLCAFLL